jgi:hypothetical protein
MADILYGVKRVVATPLDINTNLVDTTAKAIVIETAEEISLDPVVSKGDEKILRNSDKILAVARTQDLVYGFDVKLKDNKFDLNFIQLLDGGTIKKDAQNNVTGYSTPKGTEGKTIKPFKLEVYVEDVEGDSTKGYVKITLGKCEGTAPGFAFKNGEFYAPEFNIKARENTKAALPLYDIDFISALPTV